MMLRFWYYFILLLGLFQGILPDIKNLEHTDSSKNEKIELNVPVGSVVELLSSTEADKQGIISLYKRYNNDAKIIVEWTSKKRSYIREEFVGKIYMNDTGIFMRGVDQADVGEYFFKYNITINGKVVVLNVHVLVSTQDMEISKYLSFEEYMKILKGLERTNTLIPIMFSLVIIASIVYITTIIVYSCCKSKSRKTPESMPHDLTLVPVEGDPSSVILNWQPPQNPNGRITEEDVPLLAEAREQTADSTFIDMPEETLSLSSTVQSEHSTAAVKLQKINVPPLAVEEAAVQIHAPLPSQQDAASTSYKLSERIVHLHPRDVATDPNPTSAELLTEEQVSQYLNSYPEFLIKYLDEKLKSANGTIRL